MLSLAPKVVEGLADIRLGAFQKSLQVLVRVDGLRSPFLHDSVSEAEHLGLLVLFQIGD